MKASDLILICGTSLALQVVARLLMLKKGIRSHEMSWLWHPENYVYKWRIQMN